MTPGRRRFIKAGLAGSVLLAAAGWLNAAGARPLNDAEREMLGAIAAALLAGALPNDETQRRRLLALTVDGIAGTVAGFPLATQREIGELFGLLVVAPGRLVLTGIGRPWREARAAEVSEFLQSWRTSRFPLLQSAYAALHDLTFGAWYARPDSWETIAYPGPPRGMF